MNLKQIIEKNREATILRLYGRDFTISSEKKIYAQMYDKYKKIALRVAGDFEREYTERYDESRSIEKVRRDVRVRLGESVQPLINEIRGDLASIKIYEYTNESIMEELMDIGYFEDFETIYKYVCIKIDEIEETLEGEKIQRELRKENRGKWEVSTFGGTWGDAIVNQAEASVINAVSGLGHNIVNSVGNARSEADARRNKESLYTEKLKRDFVQSVYVAGLNMHLFVIQILDDRKMSMDGAVISGKDKERAAKILENYRSLNTDEETALDMLQEAIDINPFEIDIYVELLERFGDVNNELVNYGNYFNVDIKSIKEDLAVEEYEEKIEIIEDEEELKSKENEVIKIVQSYGLVYEESEVYELYHEKLEEMDLDYRTVDDIVFDERKIAEVARQELFEIKELVSAIGKPRYLDDTYEESLDKTLDKISKYTTMVKDKYEKQVKELLTKYDSNYRTVDSIVFDTREEANLARMEKSEIEKLIPSLSDEITEINVAYENSLIKKRELIENYQTDIKNRYIVEIDNKLKEYDIFYRTVNYYELEEDVFDSREEADAVRRESEAILQLLEGVNPPDRNSMLDYEENVKEKLVILQSNYSTVVADRYIELLQKYLADFDVLFRNVSFFVDNTREEAAQKRLKTEMSRLKYDSWEDVDNAKILLDELTTKLGLDRSHVPEYDKIIENNEIKLKTVDGHYFETREEADVARKEYFNIKELISDIKAPKKTDLLEYEWKVKEKIEKLNTEYNTVIKEKYIELMNNYLVAFDDLFCQVSMFKKGTRTEAAKAKALKFAKDAKLMSTIDVENTRKKIIELLPNLGLQREDIVEAEQYLDQKREEIVNGVPSSSGFGKFGKLFKK